MPSSFSLLLLIDVKCGGTVAAYLPRPIQSGSAGRRSCARRSRWALTLALDGGGAILHRADGNREAFMWFKHRAWIPIAWILSVVNVLAVWFAAQPGEPWHATSHALLGVLFAVGAQRLSA